MSTGARVSARLLPRHETRSPEAARLALAALAATVAVAAQACSIVVSPENERRRCDPFVVPDVCPGDDVCVDGYCSPPPAPMPADGCVAEAETCDGRDNNCNGRVDEGFDADGDGFSFCGTPRDMNGQFIAGSTSRDFQDCDDDDPNTYPGAPEICDGVRNDCLGAGPGDPPETVCPEGMRCAARLRTCVEAGDCTAFGCSAADELCDPATRRCTRTTCTPTSCGDSQRCDPATGVCVARKPDGEGCNLDDECQSRACFDLNQLGATRPNATRGVCSRACCSEAQCTSLGAGAICFEARTGARACLPPSAPAALSLAPRAAFTCTALASMCTIRTQPQGWCSGGPEAVCYFDGAYTCLFGLSSEDCGSVCERGTTCGGASTRCGYVLSNGTASGVCFASSSRTFTDAGGGCRDNGDCRDGTCVDGICRSPCCTDADCGAERCLPAPGAFSPMRCQPGVRAPAPIP